MNFATFTYDTTNHIRCVPGMEWMMRFELTTCALATRRSDR